MCRTLALFAIQTVLVATAAGQRSQDVVIDAVCVAPDGTALAGVEFAEHWQWIGGAWQATLTPGSEPARLVSDEHGHIRGTWIQGPFGGPLLGWSRERTLAVFIHPTYDEQHRAQMRGRIELAPAVRLSCSIEQHPAIEPAHLRLIVSWPRLLPWPAREDATSSFEFGADHPELEILLPRGRYELLASAGRNAAPRRTVVLTNDVNALNAGPIRVPASALDFIGEILPDWSVDAARNIELERSALADFRWKPLLIHFDGQAAERDAVAQLAEHPSRSKFAVVLFGVQQVVNAEHDPRLANVFPLLSDSSGRTRQLYGAQWQTALLDRDGKLVSHGSAIEAIAALERLLASQR